MKDIQECSKRIACHVSNLSLVHKCLIEKIGSVQLLEFLLFLFLVFFLDFSILAILFLGLLLLLDCHTGDVKPHFDQFVWARCGLLATFLRATRLATGAISIAQSKLHGNFVLSGKVRIRDFGVRQLESRPVLDIERQLGLCEFRLSPIPSSQSMLARFDVNSVPDLKRLAQSLKVLNTPGQSEFPHKHHPGMNSNKRYYKPPGQTHPAESHQKSAKESSARSPWLRDSIALR